MYETLLVIYLLVALALIGLVLVQQGKGADMGASFGAGASNTVFGSSGSGNFLTKTTSILAVAFFIISLALSNLSNSANNSKSTFENIETATQTDAATQTKSVPVDTISSNEQIPE